MRVVSKACVEPPLSNAAKNAAGRRTVKILHIKAVNAREASVDTVSPDCEQAMIGLGGVWMELLFPNACSTSDEGYSRNEQEM
jgi:hypothetical protein